MLSAILYVTDRYPKHCFNKQAGVKIKKGGQQAFAFGMLDWWLF